MHVLVVEADRRRATRLGSALQTHGYVVDIAACAEDGRWLATEGDFDAVVIDNSLPDSDGARLCASLRADGVWAPIIVVGERAPMADRIDALDAGADDCLLGRSGGEELCAHLRALVRRGTVPRPPVLTVGTLRLDPAAHEVSVAGRRLVLKGHAFAILELLMRRQGEVVSVAEIAGHCWDWAWEARSNVIAVHIHEIRRALIEAPGAPVLETIRAGGYRLVAVEPGASHGW